MDDRRIFDRFEARFPAQCATPRSDSGVDAIMKDASAEGVKVTTQGQMLLDDPVTLSIKLPDGRSPLILDGAVVWIKNEGPDSWEVGLRFNKVDLMGLQRLYKFCQPEEMNS